MWKITLPRAPLPDHTEFMSIVMRREGMPTAVLHGLESLGLIQLRTMRKPVPASFPSDIAIKVS